MKSYSLFIVAILMIACNSSKKTTKTDPGYTSLFDGKTLNGWRTYQNKPADSWSVKMVFCIAQEVKQIKVIAGLT